MEAERHLLSLRKEYQTELEKSYALEKQIAEVQKQQFNLQKSLKQQSIDLRGQIMTDAGLGKEFAQEKALRSAREIKGSELTSDERESVLKLADISWNLSNRREISLGDVSTKTNALTSRGGFQGGAAAPTADRYNREIAQTSKSLLNTLSRIENICRELGTF